MVGENLLREQRAARAVGECPHWAISGHGGFLSSPSPPQILSFDAPIQLIGAFPLVMVPIFAVPLAVLLHIASLVKLRRDARRVPAVVFGDALTRS
jgi:hypothetical protein